MTTRTWRSLALCTSPIEDPELWFPQPTDAWQIDEAKAICCRCPAIQACLQYALDTRQNHGVWGGLSEDERRTMARSRPRPPDKPHLAPCGTLAAYRRHQRRDEQPCQPCRDANARSLAERSSQKKPADGPPPLPPSQHDKCGTLAGYKRHFRDGETACQPCRDANAEACAVRRHRIATGRAA